MANKEQQMTGTGDLYTVSSLQRMIDNYGLRERHGATVWFGNRTKSDKVIDARQGYWVTVSDDQHECDKFLGVSYSPAWASLYHLLREGIEDVLIPF